VSLCSNGTGRPQRLTGQGLSSRKCSINFGVDGKLTENGVLRLIAMIPDKGFHVDVFLLI